MQHKAFVVYQANNVVILRRRVIRDHAVAPFNGTNDMLRMFPLYDSHLLDQDGDLSPKIKYANAIFTLRLSGTSPGVTDAVQYP